MVVRTFGLIERFEDDGLEGLARGGCLDDVQNDILEDPFIREETTTRVGSDTEVEGFGGFVIAYMVGEGALGPR